MISCSTVSKQEIRFHYDLATHHVNEKAAFISAVRCTDGMPGGALSLSANGEKDQDRLRTRCHGRQGCNARCRGAPATQTRLGEMVHHYFAAADFGIVIYFRSPKLAA